MELCARHTARTHRGTIASPRRPAKRLRPTTGSVSIPLAATESPSSSRCLLARGARLHGRIEVTDSDSPSADSELPGAVGFLQRSRILFPRPRCGTNFLVRCDGSTTAVWVSHEVSGHQALHRGCRPQDER